MATAPDIAVTLQCPAGWFDKTMLVYSAPAEAGRPAANIVVSRDAMGASETFREYCTRQVDAFRANLPQFHREDEGPGRVHGFDAFQILFSWRSAAGTLRQRVFFISAGSGVVVTYTSTATEAEFAEHEPAFQQGLANLHIGPAAGRTH